MIQEGDRVIYTYQGGPERTGTVVFTRDPVIVSVLDDEMRLRVSVERKNIKPEPK